MPEDILKEVTFDGMGAGDEDCTFHSFAQPEIFWRYVLPLHAEQKVERYGSVLWVTCGWQSGETINVTLRSPDGQTINSSLTATDQGAAEWYVRTTQGDPAGLYSIAFTGDTTQLNDSIELIEPLAPRAYFAEDGTLSFYGYAPHERIRLLEYRFDESSGISLMVFEHWQQFNMDGNGSLRVTLSDFTSGITRFGDRLSVPTVFVIIGDQSGHSCPVNTVDSLCPELRLDQLTRQVVSVTVLAANDQRVSVHSEPRDDAPEVVAIPGRTTLTVVGHRRVNEDLWWLVNLPDGRRGWLPDRICLH